MGEQVPNRGILLTKDPTSAPSAGWDKVPPGPQGEVKGRHLGTWSPQPVPKNSSPHRVKPEPEHPPRARVRPGQLPANPSGSSAELGVGEVESEGLREKGGIREKGGSEGSVGK